MVGGGGGEKGQQWTEGGPHPLWMVSTSSKGCTAEQGPLSWLVTYATYSMWLLY